MWINLQIPSNEGGIIGTTRLSAESHLVCVFGFTASPVSSKIKWLISLDMPKTPRNMKYSTCYEGAKGRQRAGRKKRVIKKKSTFNEIIRHANLMAGHLTKGEQRLGRGVAYKLTWNRRTFKRTSSSPWLSMVAFNLIDSPQTYADLSSWHRSIIGPRSQQRQHLDFRSCPITGFCGWKAIIRRVRLEPVTNVGSELLSNQKLYPISLRTENNQSPLAKRKRCVLCVHVTQSFCWMSMSYYCVISIKLHRWV